MSHGHRRCLGTLLHHMGEASTAGTPGDGTPKGHKLPVPPSLPDTIPLPYLKPSPTEHPVIHIPSLSRTSQHSASSGVPEFPGLGCETAWQACPAMQLTVSQRPCPHLLCSDTHSFGIPHIFGVIPATPLARGPACLSMEPRAAQRTSRTGHREIPGAPPGCCGPGRSRDVHKRLWNFAGPSVWEAERDGKELQLPCALALCSGYHPAPHCSIPALPFPK